LAEEGEERSAEGSRERGERGEREREVMLYDARKPGEMIRIRMLCSHLRGQCRSPATVSVRTVSVGERTVSKWKCSVCSVQQTVPGGRGTRIKCFTMMRSCYIKSHKYQEQSEA